MTLVSSGEFLSNGSKYFDLALDEDVCIQRGDCMFQLILKSLESQYTDQPILEHDDDLRNAITMEELRQSAHNHIHKLFAKRF